MKLVEELEGLELDYWVVKIEGWSSRYSWYLETHGLEYWQEQERSNGTPFPRYSSSDFEPWEAKERFAWEIIKREKISIFYTGEDVYGWVATTEWDPDWQKINKSYGETYLIAAMRAYVTKNYGLEVPEIKL